MIKEIRVKLDYQDIKELERVFYERNVIRNLVSFFVGLCDSDSKKEMLLNYISSYKRELEIDEAHFEMLKETVVNKYFPEELAPFRNSVNYTVDFGNGEIIYYGQQIDKNELG